MNDTPSPRIEDDDAPGPAVLRVLRASPTAREDAAAPPVSFTVEAGSVHILTGPAGAGKTALVELIAMARPPARGGVELFGEDLAAVRPRDRHALRRRIGMVFQAPRLLGALTCRDNVGLAARAAEREDPGLDSEIDQLLTWVGLARRASEPASRLDDDERRRLGLARALINRPDLVIADEPAAGAGGSAILRLLADLAQAGTPLLMTMRDAEAAIQTGAAVTRVGPYAEPLATP